jgi:hypothetical protein
MDCTHRIHASPKQLTLDANAPRARPVQVRILAEALTENGFDPTVLLRAHGLDDESLDKLMLENALAEEEGPSPSQKLDGQLLLLTAEKLSKTVAAGDKGTQRTPSKRTPLGPINTNTTRCVRQRCDSLASLVMVIGVRPLTSH